MASTSRTSSFSSSASSSKPTVDFTFEATNELAGQLLGAVAQLRELAGTPREIAPIVVSHAARLEQAKLRTMRIDRAALARKHGDSDPRVAAMTARIDAHVALARTLDSVEAQATTPVPRARKNVAIVYGRVVRTDVSPIVGATVVAIDDRGTSVAEDTTDDAGAFELRIPLSASAKPGVAKDAAAKREAAAAAAEKAAAEKAATEKAAASNEPAPLPTVRLDVRDASGRVRWREDDAAALDPAAPLYREIVIDEPAKDLPDSKIGKRASTETKKTSSRAKPKRRS